jgi:hypothetical protein
VQTAQREAGGFGNNAQAPQLPCRDLETTHSEIKKRLQVKFDFFLIFVYNIIREK